MFDGAACVHKFQIENGQVFYSNKLLETKFYNKMLAEKKLLPQFGSSNSDLNFFQRLKNMASPPDWSDNLNVNVVPFGRDQLYALTEVLEVYYLVLNESDKIY